MTIARMACSPLRMIRPASVEAWSLAELGWVTIDTRAITAPTLALYGEHSDVRDRGEALAAALPHATLEIVPGCTHSILWEATALVRARVLAWLEAR